jgi:hypothetical protein
MASIVVCQKPVEYFTFTAQPSTSPEEKTGASPNYWNSSPFTDDFLSDDSILTSPSTPISPPDPRSAFPTIGTAPDYKRKQIKVDEVEEPLDLGSFEDWLRWDDNSEEPLTDMNTLRTTDPEETVVFIEDPVSSSPLFQSRPLLTNTSTLNPRETIYSPPTSSWSFPAVRSPLQQQAALPFFMSNLSPQEEARLRDIAMPPSTSSTSNNKFPSPMSRTSSLGSPSSPTKHQQQQGTASKTGLALANTSTRQRKRKSTSSSMQQQQQYDEDSEEFDDPAPTKTHVSTTTGRGKKSSHNMIEKRYRNNLNDKIAELRDSVPSLRVMSKHEDEDEEMNGEEDLQGLTPAHKLNKATILSKATEYIAHLEKRNSYLTRENAGLKARVDAFEILVMARPQQQQQQQQQSGGYQQQRDYQQGYEAGQRAYRQGGNGSNVGLGQSPGWVP